MTPAMLTYGSSEAARFLSAEAREPHRRLHGSNSLGIESALRELGEVWNQCREPNWDGFGAVAVSSDALRWAYAFLEALPLGTPVPEIGAEPDGSFTMEWHRSPRRTLSISVGADGDLHYAALFGPSRSYGTEAFFGDVPKDILALIHRAREA